MSPDKRSKRSADGDGDGAGGALKRRFDALTVHVENRDLRVVVLEVSGRTVAGFLKDPSATDNPGGRT